MTALASALEAGCNFQLYSDGGFRHQRCAALGWALYRCKLNHNGACTLVLLAHGAKRLHATSSYEAEVIALDTAIEQAIDFLI